ncbi:MAG: AI-2E family transporter [Myxococcales bacterium]|jgi:predicted PurR-regulated permease PerM
MGEDFPDQRDRLPRWILWGGLLLATGWLFYALRGVLAPVFFAFLIAYLFDPLVDRIETSPLLRNRRIARGVAISILLFVLFVVTALVLLVLVPMVYEQVLRFVRQLPGLVQKTRSQWEPWLSQLGLEIPTSVGQALEELHLDLQSVVAKGYAPASSAVRWLLGGTASALGALVAGLVIPVFAFYLLYDFDRMTAKVAELIPPRYRDDAYDFFGEADRVLGQFLRGQFTVMAILGVLYAVGYGLIGVPLALPIGIIAGLLSFIPYVGSTTAVAMALMMTVLQGQGWMQVLWVIGVHTVIQGLEGFVITPKVMGDTVGISAIAVLFALLVGAELLGFTGVLLAVPTAAVAKILFDRLSARYLQSTFYAGSEADEVSSEASPEPTDRS